MSIPSQPGQHDESLHPRAGDGKFATKTVAEAGEVSLAPSPIAVWDTDDYEPAYTADGSLDVDTMVAQGRISGFGPDRWVTDFDEPQTKTLVGHWDGNEIVVEDILDGEVADERPDTGYWSEGLWAGQGTGSSLNAIAAEALAEHEECATIRTADPNSDEDYTPGEEEEFDEEERTIASDNYSNHGLSVGAVVTRLDPSELPEGADEDAEWFTQGGEGDEVAIDPRDLA